jgi:molybdopterin molybdotransferase
MIHYKKALLKLKRNKIKINSEIIPVENSLNRISSLDLNSPNNYPAANNTAFDGFAINSKETIKINNKNSIKFKIIKTLAAGDNPKIKRISKFSTIEVMTGAVIKKPFDTVIPIEQIKFFPNSIKSKYIIINKKIKKNNFIRFLGSDFKKGERIIKKGEIINSQHILAFKTLGVKKILVKKKPKIVFYTTGNEISNNNKIPNWKVRNSNSHYLKSFLENLPFNFIEKKILRDNDLIKFKKEIKINLKSNTDLIITSGAVSAGKFDFVPKIINSFKLKYYFKGVYIRPGKPIMFAKFKKNKAFFGLPGNPISSAACFRFFVLPFLYFSTGILENKPINSIIKNQLTKKKKFTRFLKGKLSFSKKGIAEFKAHKSQESFRIKPFTKSNAWGLFPTGKDKFKKGDFIECYTLTGIN